MVRLPELNASKEFSSDYVTKHLRLLPNHFHSKTSDLRPEKEPSPSQKDPEKSSAKEPATVPDFVLPTDLG